MFNFIFKALNIQVMTGYLFKRTMLIAAGALAYSFGSAITQKIYGTALPVWVLGTIGILMCVPQLLIGWFKNLALKTVRNAFVVADALEVTGYVILACFGDDAIYVFIACAVVAGLLNSVVGGVYAINLDCYIHVVAGNKYADYQIAVQVFGNLSSIAGGAIVALLSLFLDMQVLSLILAIMCSGVSVYNIVLINELIAETETDAYKAKLAAINAIAASN